MLVCGFRKPNTIHGHSKSAVSQYRCTTLVVPRFVKATFIFLVLSAFDWVNSGNEFIYCSLFLYLLSKLHFFANYLYNSTEIRGIRIWNILFFIDITVKISNPKFLSKFSSVTSFHPSFKQNYPI
jgi:hypothetical protein